MQYTIFIVPLILISCNEARRTDCNIDEEFKINFENCVKIAEIRASSDSLNIKIDLAQSSKAFACLEALTGVAGNIMQEDVGFGYYSNLNDFERDKKKWLEWFELHKCTINMDSAENKFKERREPLPDYDDPKVMDRILSLWPENYKDSIRQVDSLQRVKYRIDWPTKINQGS
jgi:hypothetical protein